MIFSAKSKFIEQRAGFYLDLAEAIGDGYSISRFLADNIEYFNGRSDNLASIYEQMYTSLNEPNATFSSMFADVVPADDIMIIASMDATTDDQKIAGLKSLAERVVAMARMKKKVWKAVVTPALVFPIIFIFIFVMAKWIIPQQVELFPLTEWNKFQRSLYWVSYGLVNYWYVAAAFFLVTGWWYSWTFANTTGAIRNFVNRIWVLGIPHRLHRDISGAYFISSLARLLGSNNDLVGALTTQEDSAPPFLAWHIATIKENLIVAPENPGGAFDTGLLGEEILRRLNNYAKRKEQNFVAGLIRLGTESMEKVEETVEKSSSSLNKTVMILGFALIAYTYGTYLSVQWSANRYMKEQTTQLEMLH